VRIQLDGEEHFVAPALGLFIEERHVVVFERGEAAALALVHHLGGRHARRVDVGGAIVGQVLVVPQLLTLVFGKLLAGHLEIQLGEHSLGRRRRGPPALVAAAVVGREQLGGLFQVRHGLQPDLVHRVALRVAEAALRRVVQFVANRRVAVAKAQPVVGISAQEVRLPFGLVEHRLVHR
jgi:hypothetical protein